MSRTKLLSLCLTQVQVYGRYAFLIQAVYVLFPQLRLLIGGCLKNRSAKLKFARITIQSLIALQVGLGTDPKT